MIAQGGAVIQALAYCPASRANGRPGQFKPRGYGPHDPNLNVIIGPSRLTAQGADHDLQEMRTRNR